MAITTKFKNMSDICLISLNFILKYKTNKLVMKDPFFSQIFLKCLKIISNLIFSNLKSLNNY